MEWTASAWKSALLSAMAWRDEAVVSSSLVALNMLPDRVWSGERAGASVDVEVDVVVRCGGERESVDEREGASEEKDVRREGRAEGDMGQRSWIARVAAGSMSTSSSSSGSIYSAPSPAGPTSEVSGGMRRSSSSTVSSAAIDVPNADSGARFMRVMRLEPGIVMPSSITTL